MSPAKQPSPIAEEAPKRDAVKYMPDGKVMKVQKTRQRKILSCIYCHSKKIKCLRVQPVCNNCDKLGVACVYFANERVSRGGKRHKHVKMESDDEPEPRAGSVSSSESSPASKHSDATLHTSSSSQLDNSQFGVGKDERAASPAPYDARRADMSFSFDPKRHSGSVLQTPVINTVSNITNNFFSTSGFLNPAQDADFGLSSFGFPDLASPQMFTPHFEPQDSPEAGAAARGFVRTESAVSVRKPPAAPKAPPPPPLRANPVHQLLYPFASNPETTVNYLYGTNTNYNNEQLMQELCKHLPASRERLRELVDRYVNSVHVLLPIMCDKMEEFCDEHDRFWARAHRDDGGALLFLTVYFPILYAATISEFEEYDNLLLNEDINLYLKGFNKICQYHNYPHGLKTIPLLLGNVIIQLTLPNPLTMEMLQIIRYAKFLHMHKDPTRTLRITDWRVVKFRRMLWWCIFGLDSLTSHNFCLPPVCKFDDFDVEMPLEDEPTGLNVGVLSLKIKFTYDRILSELVLRLHGLAADLSAADTEALKQMIVALYEYTQQCMDKISAHCRAHPPQLVQEMNVISFVKNHSWSYVDRALMLLHKKMLLRLPGAAAAAAPAPGNPAAGQAVATRDGGLLLSEYEDTFGVVEEANIIANFDRATLLQLKFSRHESFSYENLHNNLIPSILHNLNDFLKYNDFIKFGKYNWYVKRTIPLDLIILMFIVVTVKFKYEFMTVGELGVYVKLINKALFILNRKWFKNEKYKRMLLLANLTWEFMLKKYSIIEIVTREHKALGGGGGGDCGGGGERRADFLDYQVTGYLNMNELFSLMDVPQPVPPAGAARPPAAPRRERGILDHAVVTAQQVESHSQVKHAELMQLNEKIYYDLRNNFVDINDYCAFYSLLENIIRELMDYINR